MSLGRATNHSCHAARRLASGRHCNPGSRCHLHAHHVFSWSSRQQHHKQQALRLFAGKSSDFVHKGEDDEEEARTPPPLSAPAREFTADEMEFFDEFNFSDLVDDDDDAEEEQDREWQEEQQRRQQVRDELDQRKGRGWSDPWELTDEDWMQRRVLDDLPDWSPSLSSRISMERVKIHPDGIPTLETLANLPLPPPPPPHPALGDPKAYGRYRKRYIQDLIQKKVVAIAEPKIPPILQLSTWQEKQNAIDELYETVEAQLQAQEDILGRSPYFGTWVEQALEQYLRSIAKEQNSGGGGETETAASSSVTNDNTEDAVEEDVVIDDVDADPVFMDLYDNEDGPEEIVPKILHPLKPHKLDGPGRMVEEWELSAHRKTKRIMLRQCTRTIARTLTESPSSRVYVHGRNGTGKSATLAAIVASARKSGYIVLFLPDGDRLRQHGKYIEPNLKRKGIFDLPVLAQEVSEQLLASHRSDLEGLVATSETVEELFTEDQIKRLGLEEYTLVALLEAAQERKSLSAMCYAAVMKTLMQQDDKPFLMVLDDFNCYYDYGKYFHMEYDEQVRKPIPCNQISLFQSALDAMGISTAEESFGPKTIIKRGGIVVGTTESHAVARKFTDALTASAVQEQEGDRSDCPLCVVEVPRYSRKESDHVISNMECIGIGRLRFDRGDTVMNNNEMGYLRMVSGCVGQKLLDECIM